MKINRVINWINMYILQGVSFLIFISIFTETAQNQAAGSGPLFSIIHVLSCVWKERRCFCVKNTEIWSVDRKRRGNF